VQPAHPCPHRAAAPGALPGLPARGELATALARLLSLAAGGQFEYEIRPILRAADVAPCVLGAATGCRLGHDSFVLTRPAAADRSDLAYLAPFSD
jgi:type VI secretion system protein ImpH